jgi:hypothetical protein
VCACVRACVCVCVCECVITPRHMSHAFSKEAFGDFLICYWLLNCAAVWQKVLEQKGTDACGRSEISEITVL